MLGGVLLGILLFVGFEAAASIGEESNDPHRSIPRAVLFTIAASGAFYVVMAFAFSMGYGKEAVNEGAWAASPGAVNEMATRYIGSWFAAILDVVVILDAMALALAICVTIGRGYFALSRDGLLPKVFSKTSRYDTPWVANLMVAVGGIGLMLISSGSRTTRAASSCPALTEASCRSSRRTDSPRSSSRRRSARSRWSSSTSSSPSSHSASCGMPAASCGSTPCSSSPSRRRSSATSARSSPGRTTGRTSTGRRSTGRSGVIAVAVVWFVVVLLLRPANVRSAASHAAEHRGVAPLDERLDYEPLPEGDMPL